MSRATNQDIARRLREMEANQAEIRARVARNQQLAVEIVGLIDRNKPLADSLELANVKWGRLLDGAAPVAVTTDVVEEMIHSAIDAQPTAEYQIGTKKTRFVVREG